MGSVADSTAGIASALGIDLSNSGVDPWQRSVINIVCERYLAPHVDQAKIFLAHDSQSPAFNLDDKGNIQLGYDETGLTIIFSGNIISIETALQQQTILTVCNAGYRLAQLRTNQSFEQQSAGDIVQSLADLADVETDTVESGVDLPFYVVDDSLNLYQHIAELAAKSGLLAGISGEGKLNFKAAPAAAAKKTFRYGVDIVQMSTTYSQPSLNKITLIGAGAAGSQGADAWSWLIKDPQSITASVGDGSKNRLLIDPSLRSSAGVQQASAGKLFFANRQGVKTKLTVVGAADIHVGSKIDIADMPQAELNGSALVESVKHYYSKDQGFISEVTAQIEVGTSIDSLLSSALNLGGSMGGLL